jgi:phosphatidylserine/phosphatidylglycerophosphate/cardiolipin synthase-like enzyme
VHKLFEKASFQILIMGFIVGPDITEMLTRLLRQAAIEVHLVLDPNNNSEIRLASHPRLFVYRPSEGRLMHIKAIVVDPAGAGGEALLGSANFSRSALGKGGPSDKHNWEMGVRLGRHSASHIWDIFQSLRDRGFLESHAIGE